MLTRRQLVAGLGSAFVSAGVVSSTAAFTATSSSSEASFVVVYPDLIELTPVNDPPIHVEANESGYVTAITPGGDTGLNQRAITRFEDIVAITNAGTVDLTGLYFEFETDSDVLDAETLAEVEAALSVTAGGQTLRTSGESGDDLLDVSAHGAADDSVLTPGESIPFGVQVDLIADHGASTRTDLPAPGDHDVTLRLVVEGDE
ncbi:hypothetical protein [Halobellus captivus]|uniref:hypothetical protein n=1 Tax=Halobellus captivus TaxID=2592614 RepID=UPI0011A085C2|nr:hypothetical protein [Halobellus captivus]